MRTPTALDAMARWLVLTLAGLGLFAMFPATSFALSGLVSARWLVALHPIQWFAVVMMVAAWLLFAVHLARLVAGRARDGAFIVLAAASVLALAGSVAAALLGSATFVLLGLAVVVVLHVALCLRVEALAHHVPVCAAAGQAQAGTAGAMPAPRG